MSRLRTAKEICERALRAINAFPITDSAADGEQLREAMDWLDIIMAERAGVATLFSLIPETLSITLTNGGTGSYNLNTALGADLPVDRVQFPVQAWIEDTAGNRSPVEIVQRKKFEDVYNAADTGQPVMIYIDRMVLTPTLRTYPTRATGDTTVDTLKLVVQTYAPNVSPGGVTGTQPSASIATAFSQAWQRWLIWTLASDLGSGPVIKLPKASLDNFNSKSAASLLALQAFENREHETTPPIAEAWD